MGDLSEHIAQLARYRFPDKVVPASLRPTFHELGALDVDIARKLTRLLQTEDIELAEEIRNDDDRIDDLHVGVFDAVLGETWKGAAVDTVDATLASRYHERFADHAVTDREADPVPRHRRRHRRRRLTGTHPQRTTRRARSARSRARRVCRC